MFSYFDSNRINFDDDVIKVYKGRKIVFHGQFDQYFEHSSEFDELFVYNNDKHVYVGHGIAKGFKVSKVK